MSIDQFGQFRRKKTRQSKGTDQVKFSFIITYLKGLFRPHDQFTRYYLIFFILYWILAFYIGASEIMSEINENTSVLIIFLSILSALVIAFTIHFLVVFPLAYIFDKYPYFAYPLAGCAILITINILLINRDYNNSLNYLLPNGLNQDLQQSEDVALTPATYYCHNATETFVTDLNKIRRIRQINPKDTIQVIGERGDFYRANINTDTFYIPKTSVSYLGEKERQELKRLSALQIFSKPSQTLRFSDNTLLQIADRYIYIGESSTGKNRSGKGTLIWKKDRKTDSIYIG